MKYKSKPKILLIDDDIISVINIKTILTKLGFNQLDVLKNEFEAIVKSGKYDIIIINDSVIPAGDCETIKMLRDDNKEKLILVMLGNKQKLTNFDEQSIYLTDPIDKATIVNMFKHQHII